MNNLKTMALAIFAGALLLTSCETNSGESASTPKTVELTNITDSASYALGVNLAHSLMDNGFEKINPEIMSAALHQVYAATPTLIDLEQTNEIIQNYQMASVAMAGESNRMESEAFLAENATKEGVVTTASGLQYKVVTEGNGPLAQPGETVVAHYHGTLIDGQVFDSSVDRGTPFEFPLGQGRVIRGWDEAFSLMPKGSKWIIYLSPDLAYGDNPRPGGLIEPGMALIFEVELLDIKPVTK